jgi:hypothetical protein
MKVSGNVRSIGKEVYLVSHLRFTQYEETEKYW